MAEALVDTDILSELLRGRNARIVARARDHVSRSGPFAISSVTVMELAKGLEKAGRIQDLNRLLSSLGALPVLAFRTDDFENGWSIFKRGRVIVQLLAERIVGATDTTG